MNPQKNSHDTIGTVKTPGLFAAFKDVFKKKDAPDASDRKKNSYDTIGTVKR